MSLERTISTGKFVLSIYTSSGTIYTNTITASSISSTGTCVNITSSSTSLSFTASTCYLFFTEQSTDYEKYSVEWDLYEYAKNVLSKISTPSYTFKIDSANFLSIAEYENFKNSLTLGNKIYLDIGTGTILNPFVIGVDINFEDPSDFALSFSSKYSSNDSAFALVD
jgi:hypothetical protein